MVGCAIQSNFGIAQVMLSCFKTMGYAYFIVVGPFVGGNVTLKTIYILYNHGSNYGQALRALVWTFTCLQITAGAGNENHQHTDNRIHADQYPDLVEVGCRLWVILYDNGLS